jgi:[ribosomal protein S18]-alanine N-acetyltransferase
LQKLVVGRVGDYDIRNCATTDIAAIVSINMKTLPEHYSDYFYYEILAEFPETFLVAELGDSVVGYIMCRVEFGFSHLRRFGLSKKGHIVSVAVLPEHRGRGVGTRLIEQAQGEMVKKAVKEVYLEVRVSNTEAISLYERMNYKRVSRLEGYYRDGEAAYLMAAPLQKQS